MPLHLLSLFAGILLALTSNSVLAVPIDIPKDPQRTSDQAEQFLRGVAALKEGDLQKAEGLFQEALRLNPEEPNALLGLAQAAMQRGQPQKAEAILKKALKLASHREKVQRGWGRFLYSQKRFAEAEGVLRNAISLIPDSARLHVDLGDLLLQALKKPKEAIPVYQKALKLQPGHAGAHYALGTALAATGESDRALAEFEEASRLSPNNPLPFLALGRLHTGRKAYDQALDFFSNALVAKPDLFHAHIARGDVFLLKAQDDKALEEYKAALAIQPKFAPAYLQIGMVQQKKLKWAEAEQAYLTVIKLDPKQAVAYNNLAWLAATQKSQLYKGLQWARKAVELGSKIPQFQDTLGWVHHARGELAQAAIILKEASSKAPEQAAIWYHLGMVLDDQGNTQEAQAALTKALALEQDFVGRDDAKLRLARIQ